MQLVICNFCHFKGISNLDFPFMWFSSVPVPEYEYLSCTHAQQRGVGREWRGEDSQMCGCTTWTRTTPNFRACSVCVCLCHRSPAASKLELSERVFGYLLLPSLNTHSPTTWTNFFLKQLFVWYCSAIVQTYCFNRCSIAHQTFQLFFPVKTPLENSLYYFFTIHKKLP